MMSERLTDTTDDAEIVESLMAQEKTGLNALLTKYGSRIRGIFSRLGSGVAERVRRRCNSEGSA